jgi:holo-[acyl-carrier protein] synthase
LARLSKKNAELLRAVQKQAQACAPVKGATAGEVQPVASAVAAPAVYGKGTPGDVSSSSAVGLGVDLIEIDRIEKAIERTPRILERVFTSDERAYAWNKARPAVHYAAFFAAREAVLKALGSGFAGMNFADVEIAHDARGKPEVVLHGSAHALAEQQGVVDIQISLSHTHQMAVASAVAIKKQSPPRKPEVVDPMAELTRKFKELRVLLDDLGVDGALIEETPDKQAGEQMSILLDEQAAAQTAEQPAAQTAEQAVKQPAEQPVEQETP